MRSFLLFFLSSCRRLFRAGFLAVLAATLFWLVGTLHGQTMPLRIMPLGDSITDGYNTTAAGRGGYRGDLYDLLTAAGYHVDFVGSRTLNSSNVPDPEHQGHSGWRIDQIDANMASYLAGHEHLDAVLMLIGTNDFAEEYRSFTDIHTAIDRLDALILKIATLRPQTRILVSNLLWRREPENTEIQTVFNPHVEARCNAHAAAGRRVTFIDLRSALLTTDLQDGLHPSPAGYTKLANAWFAKLQTLFTPQGSLLAPAPLRADSGGDRVRLLFDKPLADASVVPANFTLSGGVSVTSAQLDDSKRVVTLTTTAQAFASYTLSISNVTDRSTPAISIPSGTTITFSGGRGYPAAVRSDGPLAYFRLDENAGTQLVNDRGEAALHASTTGTIQLNVAGPQAPSFPGLPAAHTAAGFTAVAGSYGLATLSNNKIKTSYTMEVWFKTSTSSQQTLLSLGSPGSSSRWINLMVNSSGELGLDLRNAGGSSATVVNGGSSTSAWVTFDSNTPVANGQWRYAAAVFSPDSTDGDANAATGYRTDLWLDPATTAPNWTFYHNNANPDETAIALGATLRSGTSGVQALSLLNGQIDEAAVYPMALSGARILAHYLAAQQAVTWPPLAHGVNLSTLQNTALGITLAGSGGNGSPLGFAIVGSPANGTLTGTAPALTYTPASGFTGMDSFTFKTNDGSSDSNTATVSLSVTAANNAPIIGTAAWADELSVTLPASTSVHVVASDPDGDPLNYSWTKVSGPGTATFGTATAADSTVSFSTAGSYVLGVTISDGRGGSVTSSTGVTVLPAPPVATPQSLSTPRNTALAITLGASGGTGGPYTYTVVGSPAQGVLSGTAPVLTYTPASGYTGADSFTFKANDGLNDSNTATISITVTPPNTHPAITSAASATPSAVTLPAGVTLSVTASDADNDTLGYAWSTVSGPGIVTYATPSASSTGASFATAGSYIISVTVSDGRGGSASSQTSVTVSNATFSSTAYASAVLADAPFAYFNLNETSGTLADNTGSGNHDGTVTPGTGVIDLTAVGPLPPGFPGFPSGNTGAGFTGAGAGDEIIAASIGTDPIGSSYTLEAWFKTTNNGSGTPSILSLGSSTSTTRLCGIGLTTNGEISLNMRNGGASSTTVTNGSSNTTASSQWLLFDSNTVVNDNQWHYIAAVNSPDSTNGDANAATTFKTQIWLDPTSATPNFTFYHTIGNIPETNLGIGAYSRGSPATILQEFDGQIDEAAVYNTALSGTRILAHYQAAAFTPLSLWIATNYPTVPSNQRNTTDDPDTDGVSNLLEWAFGLNPALSDAASLSVTSGVITQRGSPVISVTTTPVTVDFKAVFCRRKDHATAGLIYTVQFSPDLVTWQDNTSTPTVIADDGTIEAVTVPYPFFINGKKARFFRVQVTQ